MKKTKMLVTLSLQTEIEFRSEKEYEDKLRKIVRDLEGNFTVAVESEDEMSCKKVCKK
jgi:hypothetical protein